MDLKRLDFFVAVAEANSLTSAALRMGISQPALSRQISLLEEELGVKLFQRQRRGVVLTDDGQGLYDLISRPLREIDKALKLTRLKTRKQRPSLVMWLPFTLGSVLTAPLARRFAVAAPEIALRMSDGHAERLGDLVLRRELDIAIMEGPVDTARSDDFRSALDEMSQERLVEEDIVLAGPLGGKLAGRDEISAEDVFALPLVVPSNAGQYAFYKGIIGNLTEIRNTDAAGILETDSTEQAKEMVMSGRGYALCPLSFIIDDIRNGLFTYARVGDPTFTRHLVLLTRRDSDFPEAIEKIRLIIKDEIATIVASGRWPARILF